MSKQRRTRRTGLAVVLAVTGAVALPAAHAAADGVPSPAKQTRDDFNGDGYADLAVAAPMATVGGKSGAGYVAVLYGSKDGLKTSTKRVFTQNTAGVPGSAEKDDEFGSALTTADLDRDGYADLVVGVGREDTADGTDAGLVEVVWGGPNGLSSGAAIASGNEYDGLGAHGHLVLADVDGDGAEDVVTVENLHDLRVLGGPFARDGSTAHAGQVVEDPFDSRVLDLAAGDLNGDGVADVAAAENDGDEYDARRVVYWYGTRDGLTPYTVVRDDDGHGLQGGENLDVGDVNADGYDDIVVGRTVEGYDSDLDTPLAKGGRITWIPGTADGPDGARATFFSQASRGVQGASERGDGFGTDVQVGDVNRDGYADVVAGLPGEDQGSVADVGTIVLLPGAAEGLTSEEARVVSQDSSGGIPGRSEKGDAFGRALHLGDTNGDGRADLAVGGPGENGGAGSVWAFRSGGFVVTGGYTIVFGNSLLGTVPDNARLGLGFTD